MLFLVFDDIGVKREDWSSLFPAHPIEQFWQLHVEIRTVHHHQEKMIERQLIDLSCSRAGTRNCRVPWNFISSSSLRQAHRPHQFKSTKTNSQEIEWTRARRQQRRRKECDHHQQLSNPIWIVNEQTFDLHTHTHTHARARAARGTDGRMRKEQALTQFILVSLNALVWRIFVLGIHLHHRSKQEGMIIDGVSRHLHVHGVCKTIDDD